MDSQCSQIQQSVADFVTEIEAKNEEVRTDFRYHSCKLPLCLQIGHLRSNLDKKNEECVMQKIRTSEVVNKLMQVSSAIPQAVAGKCPFLH